MRPQWMILVAAWVFCSSRTGMAKSVTTYIVTTQDERESTRFTLTEWLRIKERMKMMDVWLAMFSQPEKASFQPELSLFAARSAGFTLLNGVEQDSMAALADLRALKYSAQYGRAQLWLTNLVSAAFGVRTLNIDLGVEGYLQKSEVALPELSVATNYIDAETRNATGTGTSLLRYNSLNLRLFGKNIQDSSLVIKYGEYSTQRDSPYYAKLAAKAAYTGKVAGAEMQLYLARWLGFEGNHLKLLRSSGPNAITGTVSDFGLYIEISLLRIMGGLFFEEWAYELDHSSSLGERNAGRYVGIKLNF